MQPQRKRSSQIVDWLLDINKEHSQQFVDERPERIIYRKERPTEIGFFKCMDGRINLAVATHTALGIVQPWRNIGGHFDMLWHGFRESVMEWTRYSFDNARHCLAIPVYHFARGQEGEDPETVAHRGCAGAQYNTETAMLTARKLKDQFEFIYKGSGLYTLLCGFDTDWDAMILHGEHGEVLDLASVTDWPGIQLEQKLAQLFPNMHPQIMKDFMQLVIGNIEHIKEIRDEKKRPITDAEHKESILAVGRGFDWLHVPNKALICGPFDPDLDINIQKAAGLIMQNIQTNRVNPDDGIALLISKPYRQEGWEQRAAQVAAQYYADRAFKVIESGAKGLLPYLTTLTTTVNMENRKLDILSIK